MRISPVNEKLAGVLENPTVESSTRKTASEGKLKLGALGITKYSVTPSLLFPITTSARQWTVSPGEDKGDKRLTRR